ncbi:signal peptidase I [Streptomyces sp. Je 1-369]|uniref:signal peptidase I n=1 Tax=Streptomyces sp. Je 1-369 TaxID=2966192 RepID=UPI002285CC7D|nr:signal peptidase I [Streptomyces sp. Je 1-369]WAL98137.1 signal peptidase I [Streptomyces sp. Je 1-369]
MGDLAVGARSGHEGPEDRPGRSGEPDVEAVADGTTPGSDAVGDDGDGDGGATRAQDPEQPRKKPRSFWKELPLLIGIALVLALLIKTFLVQAFSIPSDSMQNTLQQGDRVLVDKLTPWFGSEPERGEVVVFRDPGHWLDGEPTPDPNAIQRVLGWVGLMPSADEKDLIKRVIGVEGDTVECKGTGPVKVNGKALNEPYVFAGNTPCSVDDQGGQFKIKVPQGKIWVMGDHRQNSLDSRYHQKQPGGGAVPVDNVVGRAIVIAWPPTRWATLPKPDTFDQPGINALSSAAPGVLGLAGAVPLVLWRRRRLTVAAARDARVSGCSTAG